MIEYTVKVYDNGDKFWFLNDKYHREDGPAVEWVDGYKAWYRNGKLHREDGPAVEYPNGDKEWFFDDLRHREDGPAVELADGTKFWFLNGTKVTEEEFNQRTRKHTIVIDGETIEISEESYQNIKDSLTS